MPSNILTCHDHRLRSHHGLLLTITTAPSRLFTSRRRLLAPAAELAKICANDKFRRYISGPIVLAVRF